MNNEPQIVSASRRTDLPALYLDWFTRRISEGFCITRNPMNPRQTRQVSLCPEHVACIVFWSKNPAPLLSKLDALRPYPWYLQYTLNAYGTDIEPGLPSERVRIDTFLRLCDHLGPERVLWRYDPIFTSPKHPVEFHIEAFSRISNALKGYTERCTLSFFDLYKKNQKAAMQSGIQRPNGAEIATLSAAIAAIAKSNGQIPAACAEAANLTGAGIVPARCVDSSLISRIAKTPIPPRKDKSQRPACGCAPSVDVGAYHTCTHGCLYCYANYSQKSAMANRMRHDPISPSMLGDT